ncbi:MAG: prolyl oligopeptidase family serine peptidase, partial [Burkholderiaceae bacterium]
MLMLAPAFSTAQGTPGADTAGPAAMRAAAATPRPIGFDAFAGWRSIQGAVLSRDGAYAAYALVGQESDGELVVRRLADGREWRAPRGSAPAFSADGRYLAFALQPSRAELDQAKKDKKTQGEDLPKPGLGLMDLASGKVEITFERVKRFAWPEEGGAQLALLLEAPKSARKKEAAADKSTGDEASDQAEAEAPGAPAKKKEPGTELLLIDAASGQRRSASDVADFVWARSGAWLAYTVSVKDALARPGAKPDPKADAGMAADSAREGVYLIRPGDALAPALLLLGGAGRYAQLRFDEAGQALAFVSNRDAVGAQAAQAEEPVDKVEGKPGAEDKAAAKAPTPFKLYLWREGQDQAAVLVDAQTAGMPAGWTPSEHGALRFSKDGQRLFLGTALLPPPQPKDAPEPLKVDLWHWKDGLLQSQQKVRAERERARSYRAVVHLATAAAAARFVQLATPDMPELQVNENARVALGSSELPYQPLQSWDGSYRDVYAVDLQSGERRALTRKLRGTAKLSPTGRYALAFEPEKKQWTAWRMADGQALALTRAIKARFDNIERDVPEPGEPYGMAGWSADDESVVLYDQFDLWAVQPATLKAGNLTAGFGRKNGLQLRVVPLDPEEVEDRSLPSGELMLSAAHEVNRSTGYYRLRASGGTPQRLIQSDKLIGGLLKAKNSERVLFTAQSFVEFPDLWTSAGLDLAAPQKISAANPQQAEYRWGTQEQIEYRAANGKKLRALLAKPADFDPRKKYPLMVYIYERLSDKLYQYVPPAPSQNINISRFVSQGYLVLRPDIVYETGHPGKSAMNSVLPAVQQLVGAGYVDPRRIGIQGHSWGAYQINYLITHTKLFTAAEAGASMANMVSGYGGIRWGTGISRAFQYEKGQSRIGAAPWQRPELYLENSPIFKVQKVSTPYLTIHNDEDDAVPWYQAIEFFTALRQLGKEAYWFNYNGAKHGLRDREQMKHYSVHMAEFFDHYLLGAPRPEWMDKPVPYLERGKRDV